VHFSQSVAYLHSMTIAEAAFTDRPPPTNLALELLERWCWWLILPGTNVPLFARSGKPRGVVAIGA
jgi:hypothetical protein